MKAISKVIILNYYKRKTEGLIVEKLLKEVCTPLGISVEISFDDGSLGIWNNYKQALKIPSEPERFRLILHDDITVGRQTIEKVLHIMKYAPETFLSFYCPTNKGYREAAAAGFHVLKTHTNFWIQAFATPTGKIDQLIAWDAENIRPDYKWDDRRILEFSKAKDIPIHAILPSLFQHLGAYRSTFGIPGKIKGVPRYSTMYNTEFQVEKMDWEYEFQNPFKNEQASDYLKDMQIKFRDSQ